MDSVLDRVITVFWRQGAEELEFWVPSEGYASMILQDLNLSLVGLQECVWDFTNQYGIRTPQAAPRVETLDSTTGLVIFYFDPHESEALNPRGHWVPQTAIQHADLHLAQFFRDIQDRLN